MKRLMHRSKLDAVGRLAGGWITFDCPRQHDFELRKMSGLRLDIYAAAVLLYDDVVAHRHAKPGTFARGLGCKKRIEYLLFDLIRDTSTVIANADFDSLAVIFRGDDQH